VIDVGSRRPIGWAIADPLRTELINRALTAAVARVIQSLGGSTPDTVNLTSN
jgi:transposase InsO family protein